MDTYSAPCHRDYTAFRHSGTRPNSDVRLIVMHSTEGGTAESNARYFSSTAAEGSAHLVVDDKECYRCLDNNQVPWGAPGANVSGFHIEQAAYARWTRAEWMKHDHLLHRGAYKAAAHLVVFGFEPVFLTAAAVKRGHKGITTHAEISLAFPNNSGNHHDPGTGWPRDTWMGYVRHYYAELSD